MKQLFSLFLFLFLAVSSFAQGKYADREKRKLVGKTYLDEKDISILKGYSFHQGSLISDIHDPVSQLLTVLIKGKSGVVLFAVKEDTVTNLKHIVDIIEIKNIPAGWEIKTMGCQEGETEGEIIVALVYPGKEEFTKSVKYAWRCNRDKIRFERINAMNVKCMNEEQY